MSYLAEVWRAVHDTPGWVSILGLESQDEAFLIDLDDAWLDSLRELRRQHALRSPNQGRPQVDLDWASGRRLEYAEGRAAAGKAELKALRLERGRAARDGDDFTEAFCGLREKELVSELQRLTATVERQTAPIERRITDEMIEQARQVPISAVLQSDKKMVSCPFHEDRHPSASIAKAFFKCFSCGKRLDAIGWLVEVDGMQFLDAVRHLQSK